MLFEDFIKSLQGKSGKEKKDAISDYILANNDDFTLEKIKEMLLQVNPIFRHELIMELINRDSLNANDLDSIVLMNLNEEGESFNVSNLNTMIETFLDQNNSDIKDLVSLATLLSIVEYSCEDLVKKYVKRQQWSKEDLVKVVDEAIRNYDEYGIAESLLEFSFQEMSFEDKLEIMKGFIDDSNVSWKNIYRIIDICFHAENFDLQNNFKSMHQTFYDYPILFLYFYDKSIDRKNVPSTTFHIDALSKIYETNVERLDFVGLASDLQIVKKTELSNFKELFNQCPDYALLNFFCQRLSGTTLEKTMLETCPERILAKSNFFNDENPEKIAAKKDEFYRILSSGKLGLLEYFEHDATGKSSLEKAFGFKSKEYFADKRTDFLDVFCSYYAQDRIGKLIKMVKTPFKRKIEFLAESLKREERKAFIESNATKDSKRKKAFEFEDDISTEKNQQYLLIGNNKFPLKKIDKRLVSNLKEAFDEGFKIGIEIEFNNLKAEWQKKSPAQIEGESRLFTIIHEFGLKGGGLELTSNPPIRSYQHLIAALNDMNLGAQELGLHHDDKYYLGYKAMFEEIEEENQPIKKIIRSKNKETRLNAYKDLGLEDRLRGSVHVHLSMEKFIGRSGALNYDKDETLFHELVKRNILENWLIFEKMIYEILSQRNIIAKDLNKPTYSEPIGTELRNDFEFPNLIADALKTKRNFSLNIVHAFEKYSTIEFRLHDKTENPIEIMYFTGATIELSKASIKEAQIEMEKRQELSKTGKKKNEIEEEIKKWRKSEIIPKRAEIMGEITDYFLDHYAYNNEFEPSQSPKSIKITKLKQKENTETFVLN